jgi:hypothetical protein
LKAIGVMAWRGENGGAVSSNICRLMKIVMAKKYHQWLMAAYINRNEMAAMKITVAKWHLKISKHQSAKIMK